MAKKETQLVLVLPREQKREKTANMVCANIGLCVFVDVY